MNLDGFYTTHTRLTRTVAGFPKRYLYPELAVPRRLLAVVGPRGVGKTTLLLQFLANEFGNPAEALYISADHIHVASAGLYAIAEEHHRSGGTLLAIDEIHKSPNWGQQLKSIYDSFPKMRLIVSGSSALELTRVGHDLSRRLVKHEMMGLSFREFIGFKTSTFPPVVSYNRLQQEHVSIAAELSADMDVIPLFREYLRVGYYPFWMEGEQDYWPKLQNVLDKTLYEDIPSAFSVRPPGVHQMKRLLSIVATSKPFLLNVSTMAREVGMARQTLYEYLDYLHQAFLITQVWLPATGKRYRRKPGKLYFDNGSLLSLLGNESSPDFKGTIRETFAVNQLRSVTDVMMSETADLQDGAGTHFEVGGRAKGGSQLPSGSRGFLLVDDTDIGAKNRIPLYLLGFLY